MIPSPPRRSSNVVPVVILGFFAGLVAEFAIDMVLDFAVTPRSLGQAEPSASSSRSRSGRWSAA